MFAKVAYFLVLALHVRLLKLRIFVSSAMMMMLLLLLDLRICLSGFFGSLFGGTGTGLRPVASGAPGRALGTSSVSHELASAVVTVPKGNQRFMANLFQMTKA